MCLLLAFWDLGAEFELRSRIRAVQIPSD